MYEVKFEIKSDNELLYVYDIIQAGIDKYGIEQVKRDAPGLYKAYEQLRFQYPESFKQTLKNDHFYQSLKDGSEKEETFSF